MRSARKKRLNQRLRKIHRHGGHCYICGRPLSANSQKNDKGFTLDHVTAAAKGGGRKDNLKPCCKQCNERKGKMDLIELKKGTVVKVEGVPFELAEDTKVFGEKENLQSDSQDMEE